MKELKEFKVQKQRNNESSDEIEKHEFISIMTDVLQQIEEVQEDYWLISILFFIFNI